MDTHYVLNTKPAGYIDLEKGWDNKEFMETITNSVYRVILQIMYGLCVDKLFLLEYNLHEFSTFVCAL